MTVEAIKTRKSMNHYTLVNQLVMSLINTSFMAAATILVLVFCDAIPYLTFRIASLFNIWLRFVTNNYATEFNLFF